MLTQSYSHSTKYLAIAAFGLLAWLSIFLNLDMLSIRMYDEARNAISAIEMLDNGEYLVRYHDGEPDTWETKPPLLIWLQAGSIKLFGYNELAVRLPTAIAAFLTAVLLWFFCARRGQFWLGFFAAMALMSSRGFNDLHIARTGDHDALLTLFLVAYSLLVFELVENEGFSKRNMLWLGLLISLAVLTKSVVGFFAAPGLLLYVVFRKKLGYFLRSPWLYAGVGLLLFIVGGYYALREYYYPGQLELVWQNELLPRYTNTSTSFTFNPEPWYYYIRNLYIRRLIPWIYFLPVFLFFGIKHKGTRTITLFASLQIACLLAIISGGTKYEWYDAPLYPFIALIIGAGTVGVLQFTKEIQRPKLQYVTVVLFALLLIIGERRTLHLNRKLHTGKLKEVEQIGYLVREAISLRAIPFEYYIITEGYHSNSRFYSKIADHNGDAKIHISPIKDNFKEGMVALACETRIIDRLLQTYPRHSVLHESRGCIFMRIEKNSE